MATDHIEQIFVSVDAGEDRLLLRVASARTEISAWLTRRVVRDTWPALVSALAGASATAPAGDANTRDAVVAFQHEQALAHSTFVERYQSRDVTPAFGGNVMLVTSVDIDDAQAADARHVTMTLRGPGGLEATLRLSLELAHGLCKLVADGAQRAQWDLDLRVGRELPSGTGSSRTVN